MGKPDLSLRRTAAMGSVGRRQSQVGTGRHVPHGPHEANRGAGPLRSTRVFDTCHPGPDTPHGARHVDVRFYSLA